MPRSITDHVVPSLPSAVDIDCVAESDGARTEYSCTSHDGTTSLVFAHQPIGETLRPGLTDEALLAVVIDRLRGVQESPLRCRETACALTKLEEALHWLHARAIDRHRRGARPHEA